MALERLYLWIAFNVFVLGMLALDLGFFHRKAHAVSLKEASIWSTVWIVLALIFNAAVYFLWGKEQALEFLTGYVIEKSLSLDNLFVFLMIFQYFAVPAIYQHRVLFWGILGALVMRAIFIAAGVALLEAFHWMIYVFGGFLIATGIKMLLRGERKLEPEKNPVVRLFHRLMPVTNEYHGQRLFLRNGGKFYATPLVLVLIVVETTDVIFALDSIPAIFAITRDPFIVYTSNVFAILGLRALYFLLAGVMEMFRYLKVGLSLVLCFVGAKMMVVDVYKIPIGISLGVVGGILIVSVVASLLAQWKEQGILRRRLGLDFLLGENPIGNRMPAFNRATVGVWALLAAVAVILGIVKWGSISTGPSWHEAITAIRVAEREWAETRQDPAGSESPSANTARTILNQAWSNLERDQYEAAISAAHEARRRLRGEFAGR